MSEASFVLGINVGASLWLLIAKYCLPAVVARCTSADFKDGVAGRAVTDFFLRIVNERERLREA